MQRETKELQLGPEMWEDGHCGGKAEKTNL